MSEFDSEAYRLQVREWLAVNAPGSDITDPHGEPTGTDLGPVKALRAAQYEAGYIGITWPVQYGGAGLGVEALAIFKDEARGYQLVTDGFLFACGDGIAGPTFLEIGTEAQKTRYLRPILQGSEIWCQLFSEPSAGSDLASLECSAVRTSGGGWVVRGQKVWTTCAQHADFGVLLTRTDRSQPKHKGITMFVLDMHAPGVTVRPLRVATGETPFNEVFIDSVGLPEDAVIGSVDHGWDAAMVMLKHERTTIGGFVRPKDAPLSSDSLIAAARKQGRLADQSMRRQLARLHLNERGLDRFMQHISEKAAANGTDPGPAGSIGKLFGCRLDEVSVTVATNVYGGQLAAYEAGSTMADVTKVMLEAFCYSIAGGSNQIQSNIIAERILGLPKDPGVDRRTRFDQLRVGTLPPAPQGSS